MATLSRDDLEEPMEEVLAGHNLVRSEAEVAKRYQSLYENAMKHFNAVKEVNKFSRHDWRGFFAKTFEVFSELWQYLGLNMESLRRSGLLQSHRTADVASKIGQMFYHTYVLSSDVEFLHQAYWFYTAVQDRGFMDSSRETCQQSSHIMLLRLRYLARFISVTLLLGRSRVLGELVEKLEKQASAYQTLYPGSHDSSDWSNTAVEARSMLEALELVQVPSHEVLLEHRLPVTPGYMRPHGSLSLDEAVLVSCTHKQVRFSQLSLDMIRMVYTLELQAADRHLPRHKHPDAAGLPPQIPKLDRKSVANPKKCLLHRPSVPELLAELSMIMKDSSPNSITLLYFSCNSTSCFDQSDSSTPEKQRNAGTTGATAGLSLRSSGGVAAAPEDNLYPSDLVTYTRRPMLLIVDSDHASSFQAVKSPFHQPFVSLLAAAQLPDDFSDYQLNGRLLTLFLACPLTAFCHVCNLVDVAESLWRAASEVMNAVMAAILNGLRSSSQLDADVCLFLDDVFTATLICRFVLALLVFRYHYAFPNPSFYPTSCPPLPDDAIASPRLRAVLMAVATSLDVQQLFE